MDFTGLLIQFMGDPAGGKGITAMYEKLSLRLILDIILGLVGGFLGGQLAGLIPFLDPNALDIGGVLAGLIGGGIGGCALTGIVGIIRNAISK